MTDEKKELSFTFDLEKVDIFEAMDALSFDPDNIDPKYVPNLMATLKKALVKGDVRISAVHLPTVIRAFMSAVLGGGEDSKN